MNDSPEQPSGGCQICGSPTGDGAGLCRTHTDGLATDLRSLLPRWETRNGRPEQITGLVADLEVTITRQDRLEAGKHGGRSATTPLVWKEHASARALELNTTINAWALDTSRLDEDERDQLADNHHTDTAAVASWLLRNLATLRRHTEAGQAFTEVTDSIHQAQRAVDKPPEQVTYGPCGNTEDLDEPCREYLYALPGKPTVTCRTCGARYDTAARLEWMRQYAREMLATATEAAGYLRLTGVNTSPEAVRALADRDRIVSVAVDARGRPLYRIADVVQAIGDRYKRRKTSSPAA